MLPVDVGHTTVEADFCRSPAKAWLLRTPRELVCPSVCAVHEDSVPFGGGIIPRGSFKNMQKVHAEVKANVCVSAWKNNVRIYELTNTIMSSGVVF